MAAVLVLVVAACGGDNSDAALPVTTTAPSVAATTGPTPATVPGAESGTATTAATGPSAAERPAPNPDRELAPDFTLNLGSGSTFVLSEETRPVFMVFWAEW